MRVGIWIRGGKNDAVRTRSSRNFRLQCHVADHVVTKARGPGGLGVWSAQNALFLVVTGIGHQWQEFVEMPARRRIPRLGRRQRLIEYRRGALLGIDPFTDEDRVAIVVL